MTVRKNTSVRLSDEEKTALEAIQQKTGTKPASLIQKAIRKYIRDYKKIGSALIMDDPLDPEELKIEGVASVTIDSKFRNQTSPSARSRKA